MADGERRWLADGLASWKIALRHFLKADDHPLPQIIVYDQRCSYSLAPGASVQSGWRSTLHGGQVTLPEGTRIPAEPNAFNAVTDDGRNYMVMSLPSVWRPVAPKSEVALETFLEGVLLHELTHNYQAAVTRTASFAAMQRAGLLPDKISDDAVQEAFGENPVYVRAYEAERDLLFRAASAPTNIEARALTCEALGLLRQRRERHFTPGSHWAAVDELSLTAEGLAQWVSYAWLTSGRGLPAAVVFKDLRSTFWSQDHGLAIFLVVDRLVPHWQRSALASPPASAEPLLSRACGR